VASSFAELLVLTRADARGDAGRALGPLQRLRSTVNPKAGLKWNVASASRCALPMRPRFARPRSRRCPQARSWAAPNVRDPVTCPVPEPVEPQLRALRAGDRERQSGAQARACVEHHSRRRLRAVARRFVHDRRVQHPAPGPDRLHRPEFLLEHEPTIRATSSAIPTAPSNT
jgi:hypothetical protein